MSFPTRYTVTDSGCWEWQGAKTFNGYGQTSHEGKDWRAHRLAWTMARGPIPDGLFVLHRCDNRPCINPDHLFLGTQADNMHDAIEKGRFRYLAVRTGEDHPRAKLTNAQTAEIAALARGGWNYSDISEVYGVTKARISKIKLSTT